jgi:hypothetical protein
MTRLRHMLDAERIPSRSTTATPQATDAVLNIRYVTGAIRIVMESALLSRWHPAHDDQQRTMNRTDLPDLA